MPTTTSSHPGRLHIQPGFRWDAQDAYLFDIDGTLLRSRDRIHFKAFSAAILQVTGEDAPLDGVSIHGSTDTMILREAFHLAGWSPQRIAPHWDAILEAMRQFVVNRRDELDLQLMPCVQETLRFLTARGAHLGVATGNLETIGWTKIEKAGLRPWFSFGGFSDHFPVRCELIANAVRTARELAGPEASICVVGDTPRDIEAARANALPVIALATGFFSFDALMEFHPEVCAASLADLLAYSEALA
jgi:phosphoglycolate phosphatase-like HAD superfamily hydrolase